ncbi:lysozyme inhibitor LprI family protein [Neorhizobium sp. P12A]|uniref:lysozyme inhibitor LprI family protein n=1 Tax=Neorhizobium sp. P12A TaxID=2268027 RepID=UPI00165E3CD6|nr:lysozyme inhibitor LprI family protein [Neorhizobium sp. P12A]
MKFSWLGACAGIGMLCFAGMAHAEDDAQVDCKNAVTQTDMNICADRDYKAADAELNVQYKETRATMVSWDADLDDDLKGAEKALLKAQRAWVDYRDGECEAEGFEARGGTMEPMLVSACLASVTRERTKQLKQLADGLGN